ncbi:sigma-70 family RNA polymerase sigma factor [Nocardioides limicola]|uniref:sigma-70 family RNA polymerase sigma factor n=1 Tax=Nocardioides limicola TaxID=2803368 RepID=UPI00193BA80F|nr:sigma-70 family RNA polymerase sigma factor [Nocardioides sp. DJM-14]
MTVINVADDLEPFRTELIGYCYRYFGSIAEAEDAVQEAMTRAWMNADTFEGRSSVRTWLYRIATNVCLDMRDAAQRRALPCDLTGPGEVPAGPAGLTAAPAEAWLTPIADRLLFAGIDDPAERAATRESVRFAFLSALQLLPPRQRVVLILRDVLSWTARETAELLELSVDSVNSALARARRTVASHDTAASRSPDSEEERTLLTRYTDAFERYDVDALVDLLAADATFTMPPYELWLQGHEVIRRWWDGPGRVCVGSRVVTAAVNGMPTVAVYHPTGTGDFAPFAVHALQVHDGRIAGITHFLGAEVFAQLGLPEKISG